MEVTAPEYKIYTRVFLAGGISNCPDWQSEFINKCEHLPVILYNPRRTNFDINNTDDTYDQIHWEHNMMENSDIIVFWFSSGSLNPIVLYELGKYIRSNKQIIIGIDPEYSRKDDVIIQSELAKNQTLKFSYSLDDLVNELNKYLTMSKFMV